MTREDETDMKKRINTWYIACIIISLIAFLITLYIWKDYLLSQVKFSTEAVLMDTDVREKQKLKNKDDPNRTNYNKYDTYYEYKLTWRFENIYSEKKYSFYEERESSTKPTEKIGDKKTVFVYYNDNEEDYEIADDSSSLLFGIAGIVFLMIPAVGTIKGGIKSLRSRKK